MAMTIGTEYDHIDITNGVGTIRHPLKDASAREMAENLVKVQDAQPESDDNVVWVKETPENEVEVPTYEEFNELKSAFNIVERHHTSATYEATHDIEYPDFYDQTTGFGGYISGDLNGAGAVIENDNYRVTKDFIPVDISKHYRLQALGISGLTAQTICYYDENKAFISYVINTALQNMSFPDGTKYIKYTITKNQYDTYMPSGLVMATVPSASSVITRNDVVTKIPLNNVSIPYLDEINKGIVYEKGYISCSGNVRITKGTGSDYSVYVSFGNKLVANFGGKTGRTVLEWSAISTEISSAITISGSSAMITVGTFRWLVLNVSDYKLYIRTYDALKYDDYVIVCNDNKILQGWAVNIENYQLRFVSNDVIVGTGVGKYNKYENGFNVSIRDFSTSLLGLSDWEAFIFITDPHTFGIGDVLSDESYQMQIANVFNSAETCYKSSPAMFILYGGDWLNNSDTPEIAASKLGMIRGAVKNTTPSYLLVGNHDTNYQGTERLSTQSMKNLWYDGNNTYFKFKGRDTVYYCFDTGVEGQGLDSQDYLGRDQVEWFAMSLLTEESPHIAIAVHILYPTSSDPETLQPLTDQVLAIANIYNNRDSITFNDRTYNYSNGTGRVEFLIAGHTHKDENFFRHNIPCVVTRNAFIPSNDTIAFDLVTVDYDNKLIKTFRVGTGENRTINMADGQLVT